MKYTDWKPVHRIEFQYSKLINSLIDKLFKEFDFYNPFEYVSNIVDAINSETFYNLTQIVANRMMQDMYKANSQDWREAYKQSTHGKAMYQALQKELQGPIGNLVNSKVQQNANLITNLPIDICNEITSYVTTQQMRGRRADDIANDLMKKVPNMTRARCNLIARTECSKADTALNQARSMEMGISGYIWRTSEDGRVRSSHRHMDKVLVFWNNPPSPEELIHTKTYGHYHAGDIFQCRCYTECIIDIDLLTFPQKVYYNNQIVRMTRKQLQNLL